MGKGSSIRPYNGKRFRNNYDKIYWESDKIEKCEEQFYYGIKDGDKLESSIDEVLQNYLDFNFDGIVDEIPVTIEITKYKRKEILVDKIEDEAINLVNKILEKYDEEYTYENADLNEPSKYSIKLVKELLLEIIDNFYVTICDVVELFEVTISNYIDIEELRKEWS